MVSCWSDRFRFSWELGCFSGTYKHVIWLYLGQYVDFMSHFQCFLLLEDTGVFLPSRASARRWQRREADLRFLGVGIQQRDKVEKLVT